MNKVLKWCKENNITLKECLFWAIVGSVWAVCWTSAGVLMYLILRLVI